ncbi:solute carrier family 23 protein [Streptomyces eurythermus]
MLAAGVFGLLIAYPFAKAVRFFPPLVSGVVITVVGLALIGVGVNLVSGTTRRPPVTRRLRGSRSPRSSSS